MVRTLVCCLLLAACAAADPPQGPDGRGDAARMNGTWKPARAELAGQPWPEALLKATTLTVADGAYTLTLGEQTDAGELKIDPAKSPRVMDIVGKKGPNAGKSIPCIYEITDTTLKVCYDLGGGERPRAFATRAGTKLFLVEYRRAKP